jgi:effector-binding domain-containing protein
MEKKNVPAKNYLVFNTRTTLNKIMEVADQEVGKLYATLEQNQIKQAGPLEFIYFDCTSDIEKEFELEIAMPVENSLKVVPQGYSLKNHESFPCVSHIHKGDITQLYEVYDKLFTELWDNSIKPTNQIREVYAVYKSKTDAENVTEIQIGIQ